MYVKYSSNKQQQSQSQWQKSRKLRNDTAALSLARLESFKKYPSYIKNFIYNY